MRNIFVTICVMLVGNGCNTTSRPQHTTDTISTIASHDLISTHTVIPVAKIVDISLFGEDEKRLHHETRYGTDSTHVKKTIEVILSLSKGLINDETNSHVLVLSLLDTIVLPHKLNKQ